MPVKPPAFQFYPADFIMGTRMMNPEEVGAYIRLLCHQWDTGFVPNNERLLMRLTGLDPARYGPAMLNILYKFEKGEDGQLRNLRLEQERQKQKAYRDKQSENASKRWVGNAKLMPPHMPNACSPSPSPSSNQILIEVDAFNEEGLIPKETRQLEEEIYSAYPRKQGKKAALKAINSVLKDRPDLLLTLGATVQAYAAATALWPDSEKQFIPHPATWFNRGSYDDDPETWKRNAKPNPHLRANDRSYSQVDDYSKYQPPADGVATGA